MKKLAVFMFVLCSSVQMYGQTAYKFSFNGLDGNSSQNDFISVMKSINAIEYKNGPLSSIYGGEHWSHKYLIVPYFEESKLKQLLIVYHEVNVLELSEKIDFFEKLELYLFLQFGKPYFSVIKQFADSFPDDYKSIMENQLPAMIKNIGNLYSLWKDEPTNSAIRLEFDKNNNIGIIIRYVYNDKRYMQ